MPVVVTASEYLTVNGVILATPAWRVLDLSALLDETDLRGDDWIIPGAAGQLPQRRTRDRSRRTFPFAVFGEQDQNGGSYANPRVGLVANVEYLRANLGVATVSAAGTVTAVWTRPDASTKSAAVHVYGPIGGRKLSPTTLLTTIDLSVPAGVFA